MSIEDSERRLRQAAWALACEQHDGQVDKGGEPYFRHVQRVAMLVQTMTGNTKAVAAALLHDIVEDTPVTLNGLRTHGFPEDVVQAVDALSRREGEPNRAYVLRVAANPIAVIVKRADYLDNLDPVRMAKLDVPAAKRLIRVMCDSQRILGEALLPTPPERTEETM